jgi:ATP-dependent DNA helicase RecG
LDPRARYESSDIEWLAHPDSAVEGPWVERKERADAKELARQISGFANGQPPGGLIVVGSSKTGEFPGVGGKAPDTNRLLAKLRQQVEGRWEHRLVTVPATGVELLFIWAPFSAERVVLCSDGAAYRRVGEQTVAMTPEELRELRFARGEESFEDEPALPLGPEALDETLAIDLLRGMTELNGLTLENTPTEALRHRHLVKTTPRGEFLTVAGVLAVGRAPDSFIPGARIRFLRFEGTEERFGAERNVVKDRYFDGAIPRIIPLVRDFMRDQIREFDYLGPDGLFVTEPEYPPFAWEEAIVNALVHRSYSLRNATVFVRMFEDRVEVESPGSFPGTVRPDRLHSYPRNRRLAEALRYFKLVRLAQEGTRRMVADMTQMGLPAPIFEELDGSRVRVTLRNDIERRRARQGAGAARHQWDEVARLLPDELALYRRQGLTEWRNLVSRGAKPPAAVVRAAIRALEGSGLTDPEADEVAGFLLHAGEVLKGLDVELAQSFVGGKYNGRRSLLGNLARVLGRSETALEVIASSLESNPSVAKDADFRALAERIYTSPLPAKPWLDRVLKLCAAFPQFPNSQALYEAITGRKPGDEGSGGGS